ncbi:hypothetical protein EAY64_07395 [Aquitalea palustris]|uniref:Uncharacterized protein n=1 Tax=Aquitalea palustris TaxID=2480983 RepID=A0A454JK12_9NEIS|nr:hypothetical protein EAY64_07395 [Aquitalea palustris]
MGILRVVIEIEETGSRANKTLVSCKTYLEETGNTNKRTMRLGELLHIQAQMNLKAAVTTINEQPDP